MKFSQTLICILWLGLPLPAIAQPAIANPIDLDPKLIEASPTLRKWQKGIPDVATDIKNDPAFRARLQLGYNRLDDRSGWRLGVEDLRLGKTPLTFSSHYQANGGKNRRFGGDVHYGLTGLGEVVQLAPTIGWRRIARDSDATSGLNLGMRSRLQLSRGGGADLTIDYSWLAPGSDREMGLAQLSLGYAVTQNLRLSTTWQHQQSRLGRDRGWGINLEWMPQRRN
jgi:hypothetical protein